MTTATPLRRVLKGAGATALWVVGFAVAAFAASSLAGLIGPALIEYNNTYSNGHIPATDAPFIGLQWLAPLMGLTGLYLGVLYWERFVPRFIAGGVFGFGAVFTELIFGFEYLLSSISW